MSRENYINIIYEYMLNTLDRYELEIKDIKTKKFYTYFNEEDYYKLLIAQVKYETLSDSFRVIREFLYFMQNEED